MLHRLYIYVTCPLLCAVSQIKMLQCYRNILALTSEEDLRTCAPSENSGPSTKDAKFLHADNDDSEQTAWMHRLI